MVNVNIQRGESRECYLKPYHYRVGNNEHEATHDITLVVALFLWRVLFVLLVLVEAKGGV